MPTTSKRAKKAKIGMTHRITRYAIIPIHRNGKAVYIPSKPIKTIRPVPMSEIIA